MIAGAITKGNIILENVRADHLTAVIDKLKEIGVEINTIGNSIRVKGNNLYHNVDITTLPYPGMPTDMQAQFMALLCTVEGKVLLPKRYLLTDLCMCRN